MAGPGTFRPIKNRTIGSGTRVLDEFTMPFGMYHGGRALAWAWRHRVGSGIALVIVWLWASLGSLLVALAIVGFVAAAGMVVVVGRRARPPEGGPITVASIRLALNDYLSEKQLRGVLDRQWALACETAGLTSKRGGKIPDLRRVRAIGDGTFEAEVFAGRIGVPVPNIVKQTVTLQEVIGCRDVVVTQMGPGVAKLTFHWRDPIGRNLPLADLPLSPPGEVAYGIRQDGDVATIRVNQSVLIGGLTRMGKSNAVWTLMADYVRKGIPLDLYVSDPKGGVELDALEGVVRATPRKTGEPRHSLVEVLHYAKTPAETIEMIEKAEKDMHVRQGWMKKNNVRQIDYSKDNELRESNPLRVIILDETLPLTELLKKGTDSPLGRIAYTGAAGGFVIWANTQVAQIDALGRFRDLVPQRICFATPSPQVTDAVLGGFAESMGARCSEIRSPGVGYSYAEGAQTAKKFRAALVTDEETRMIAQGKLPKKVADAAREMNARGAESETKRTALYRYYYASDTEKTRPAYIGISVDAIARDRQHNDGLRAFTMEDHFHTVEWFESRKLALAAEKKAIKEERPLFNVIHNESNPNRISDWKTRRRKSSEDDAA